MLCRRSLLRHDSDVVIDHLKKPAFDVESLLATRSAKPKRALSEQRHHRSVILQNSNLSVERRRNDRRNLAVEQNALRRDHRDLQHQPCAAILLAFSMTSSIPPAMKNACSGSVSNSPATRRSNDEIVSSSFTYLPGMFVNCSATANGWDMKRWRRRARPTTSLSSSESSSIPR